MAPDRTSLPHRVLSLPPPLTVEGRGCARLRGWWQVLSGLRAEPAPALRDPSQERAVRAWRRAGFSDCSPAQGKTGLAPVLRFAPSSW